MHLNPDLLRRLSVESGCALPTLTRFFADRSLVRGASRLRIEKALRALGLDVSPALAISNTDPLVAQALTGKVVA